jgi:hypothetical protein
VPEICAVQNRPLRISQHEARIVAAKGVGAAFRRDSKGLDAIGRGAPCLAQSGDAADSGLAEAG